MENIQDRLDEALELTFPASDPIALTPAAPIERELEASWTPGMALSSLPGARG
jgi:hypothetical protein